LELGARFWFGVLGLSIGIAIAAYLIFALIGRAWYAWGLFGMLLFIGAILVAVGWIYDRREARRRSSYTT
jgi:hypothetical protein